MRCKVQFKDGLKVEVNLTWLGRLRALFTGRVEFTVEEWEGDVEVPA